MFLALYCFWLVIVTPQGSSSIFNFTLCDPEKIVLIFERGSCGGTPHLAINSILRVFESKNSVTGVIKSG